MGRSVSLWDVLGGVRHSVEAVLSGRLEVDVRGLHLLGLRVPDIFESLSFGAHYLVVDVSDQLLGGLSGNQAMNDENQGLACHSTPTAADPSYLLGSHRSVSLLVLCPIHHHVPAKRAG